MKKSQCINEIKNLLDRLGVKSEYHYLNGEIAGEVLKLCEKLGMLPPRTKLPYIDVSDNCWDLED